MNNREKIINAIEKAKKQSEEYAQEYILVPFKEADMIIALLKEQEAIEPTFKQDEDGIVWACGSCGAYMYHNGGISKAKEYAKYCRQCGRKVMWDD